MDLPTTIRLARLALEDLAESRRYNLSSKGKGTIYSEEETVFRMQVEYVEYAIQAIEDAEFARSFDVGAEANHPSLRAVGDWQLADLRAALALLTGVGASDEGASSGSSSGIGSSTVKCVFNLQVTRMTFNLSTASRKLLVATSQHQH